MTRVLKLKGRTGLFDFPSFLLADNESLKIKVDLTDELRTGRFRLIVRCGDKEHVFALAESDTIELSAEWLRDGVENLEFALVFLNASETAVIKDDYFIESLKRESVGGNFVFTTAFQALVTRLNVQDQKIASLEEKINQYEDGGVPLVAEENE